MNLRQTEENANT